MGSTSERVPREGEFREKNQWYVKISMNNVSHFYSVLYVLIKSWEVKKKALLKWLYKC